MSRIVLNHGSYTNLLQLQQISRALNATQNILSTGKKVNSAIDNPSSYYTARSLNSRAEDLSGLLDSMSQKIQTIKVASEGIEAATSFLEQMTSVAERAIEVASSVDYLPKSYPSIFDGKSNTQKIVKQLGNKAQAAYACTQFYAPGVAADDETFGQGQWYLPSIGELMEADGYDVNAITTGVGSSGGDGKNQVKINAAIQTLIDDGVEADQINTWYWSSSEYGYAGAYAFCSHYRDGSNKIGGKAIRCFLYLENIYQPSSDNKAAPQIGDVVYADKTWSSADNYDSSKIAVGIITHVSSDNRDVTIVNLKNLSFSSYDGINNFDPEHPYDNLQGTCKWAQAWNTDIIDLPNYDSPALGNALKTEKREIKQSVAAVLQSQYNVLLGQYSSIIVDSSYKGVNLLKGDRMEVTFNESGENKLTVEGQDISTSKIGLNNAEWYEINDVAQSINEIKAAINTLRSVASDLGNNNSIIQTREDFTKNLINVLEEGADKLTLADMNEESANMLALQTRQQLAINALSLATQAEQGVLRLF